MEVWFNRAGESGKSPALESFQRDAQIAALADSRREQARHGPEVKHRDVRCLARRACPAVRAARRENPKGAPLERRIAGWSKAWSAAPADHGKELPIHPHKGLHWELIELSLTVTEIAQHDPGLNEAETRSKDSSSNGIMDLAGSKTSNALGLGLAGEVLEFV